MLQHQVSCDLALLPCTRRRSRDAILQQSLQTELFQLSSMPQVVSRDGTARRNSGAHNGPSIHSGFLTPSLHLSCCTLTYHVVSSGRVLHINVLTKADPLHLFEAVVPLASGLYNLQSAICSSKVRLQLHRMYFGDLRLCWPNPQSHNLTIQSF